jgi:hypothetical protein
MKKNFLAALTLMMVITFSAFAQDKDDDSRYLAGAVPEVNGKVVFSKDYVINGMSKDDIYNKIQSYLTDRMAKTGNPNSRVAYANKDEGSIVAIAKEWIVFHQSAISLDRTEMDYQVHATVTDGHLNVSIMRINYKYQEKEKYDAETWITDKYALNKAKTKLVRGIAKWRRKTVDLVDDYFNEIRDVFTKKVVEQPKADVQPAVDSRSGDPVVIGAQSAPVEKTVAKTPIVAKAATVAKTAAKTTAAAAETAATVPATALVPAKSVKKSAPVKVQSTPVVKAQPAAATEPALRSITPDDIPSSVASALHRCKVIVMIGSDSDNMTTMTASQGVALGYVASMPMAFTFFGSNQNTSALEGAGSYTIKFVDRNSNATVMLMHCSPMANVSSNGLRIVGGRINSAEAAE